MKTAAALLAGALVVAATFTLDATAAPPPYRAPPETATLAEGEDSAMTSALCSACHSLDYITTQPPDRPDPRTFWAAEVGKMEKAYGATFAGDARTRIIAYLARTYR